MVSMILPTVLLFLSVICFIVFLLIFIVKLVIWLNDKDRGKPFIFLFLAIGFLILIIVFGIWNAFSVLGFLGL